VLGTEDADVGYGEGSRPNIPGPALAPWAPAKAGRHPAPALTNAAKM
jgi:hypothetical protein